MSYAPLRGHTHSFHNSGRECKMEPPAWERMSLLTGISQGEPSRRDARSENYTRPSRMRPPVADESHPRFNVRDHRCVVCASPGNLGNTWDGDLPIGSGRGGHSWLLPSPWGRHPSLALHDDMLHDRNQGFLHLSKARKHCCMTLIMWSRLPLGENPLVLSHHCKGIMYSRPKGITLDTAAIQQLRIDSTQAGDICACIVVESHTPPR